MKKGRVRGDVNGIYEMVLYPSSQETRQEDQYLKANLGRVRMGGIHPLKQA